MVKIMIDKETWKIDTDRDQMEKVLKYNMMYNTIKASFWKKKAFSSKVKQFTFFLWIVAFKHTTRRNWEIHMDWQNDA